MQESHYPNQRLFARLPASARRISHETPNLPGTGSWWLANGYCRHSQETGNDAVSWPQFRGPNAAAYPLEKNYRFASGQSRMSFGKRRCYQAIRLLASGAGGSSSTSYDEAAQTKPLCLDRNSGRILWRHTAPTEKIENFFHNYGSPAVATPATDGRRIYVYFGSYGLLCDFDGNEQWKKPLPLAETFQGNGTSPIVVGDLLLLNREFRPIPPSWPFAAVQAKRLGK